MKKIKKKVAEPLPVAVVHITAGLNNTIISIADKQGNVKAWTSCGTNKFKNCKKGTPWANNVTFNTACKLLKELNPGAIEVVIRGVGPGRDLLPLLQKSGIALGSVSEETFVAYNGAKPRRARRN